MIHRDLESAFAAYLTANRTGTALAGIPIRHAVPEDPLGFPCVIATAAGAELIEGGVRSASRVNLDFATISAPNEGSGWQAAHKNRVAALSRLLDDTNTNSALAAINAAQSDFTLYGWHLTELSAETSANHQIDAVRLSAVAGDRINTTPTGPTATPMDYSLRHELEEVVAAHLAAVLPSAVTDDYQIYPYYSEGDVPPRRIVAACLSANRPFPQLARWQAASTIHVVTPGEYSTAHNATVKLVQAALRQIVANDFTTAKVTVAGLLETGHTADRTANRLTDVLASALYCQQN
jgi:hypothetical protein